MLFFPLLKNAQKTQKGIFHTRVKKNILFYKIASS